MTNEEIFKIITANPTNKFIIQHLNKDTIDLVLEIMSKLDAGDFKEARPDAEFDFSDIPIPYEKIGKESTSQTGFSADVQGKFSQLLAKINQEGTNIEYPFVIKTDENSNEYSKMKEFATGSSQTCNYDWKWIEDYIKNADGKMSFSLLHTHPNPLNRQHNTLFNKYSKELSEIGVKPNGLNISIADVYAEQYLEMLIKKYGKEISAGSTILMHDGSLISFCTKNGLTLTNEQKIENANKKEVSPIAEKNM